MPNETVTLKHTMLSAKLVAITGPITVMLNDAAINNYLVALNIPSYKFVKSYKLPRLMRTHTYKIN